MSKILDITVPSPGESITEVTLTNWLVEDGSYIEKDHDLAELESDKATLSLISEESGIISIVIPEGTVTTAGSVACRVTVQASEEFVSEESATPQTETEEKTTEKQSTNIKVSPLAASIMEQEELTISMIMKGLAKITKSDVLAAQAALLDETAVETETKSETDNNHESNNTKDNRTEVNATETNKIYPERGVKSKAITPLRKVISKKLVKVKNETAMLTTFNEIDMSYIKEMRLTFGEEFLAKYGYKLGFMSLFVKAVSMALNDYPNICSLFDLDNGVITTPNYHDIGVAVSTPKGLMVPIVRDVNRKVVSTIEGEIKELAKRARQKKITIDEMSGGVFTITNGGVFGSLFSTPIINPPQSAILGMHNIVDRPVAIKGKVEIRPMMYVALSYDHRLIDGSESVGFLKRVKELVESPIQILYGTPPLE